MHKLKLIVMSGLPGSGKSTVAEGVAKMFALPLFSVDPIESSIVASGIKRSFETGLAAYLVAESLADEQLKLDTSVIIDAVNAEEKGKNMWRNLAKKHDATLIILECALTDTKLHKKRIESRVRNLHGLSEVSWQDVETRRKKYTAWSEPTLNLDSSHSAEANIQLAAKHILSN